jgi:hypothetical protein
MFIADSQVHIWGPNTPKEIAWFTPEDKEWIMGRGLCEWLGWEQRGV